jgi:hypothetical protein
MNSDDGIFIYLKAVSSYMTGYQSISHAQTQSKLFKIVHCHDKVTYQLAFTVVTKNCEPLESGPELAIETTPATIEQVSNETT